jgi:hypothetical protein
MTRALQALEAGPTAARALAGSETGSVIAAFESSFYVDLASVLVCVGGRNFPMGPLNVRTSAWDNAVASVIPGTPVSVYDRWLDIGLHFAIDCRSVTPWRAPRIGAWSLNSLHNGLSMLSGMANHRVHVAGLSRLVFDPLHTGTDNSFHNRAAFAIGVIRAWLSGTVSERKVAVDGVQALIGLGPGLTPSGDDFLVGMMVALGEVHEHELLKVLSAMVLEFARVRTSSISAAHLKAAVEGLGTQALHRTIQSIACGGGNLANSLSALTEIGHSSGWDALAGAIVVLQATAVRGDLAQPRVLAYLE